MITLVGATSSNDFAIGTITDVVNYCENKLELGVDTETEGLDFTKHKMVMFQIGDAEHQFIIDTRVISIEPLREILESKRVSKILQNAKFDYKFIKKWADIELENVYDTFLAEKILTCGSGQLCNLAKLTEKYLKIDMPKATQMSFTRIVDGAPFTVSQITYGAKDVEYLSVIKSKQVFQVEKESLQKVLELECEATLAFADIEYNGIGVNKEDWLVIAKSSKEDAISTGLELDELIIDSPKLDAFVSKFIQGELFTPQEELRKVDIKWSSPKQVLELFQILVPKLENVNSKEMYKYRKKNPIIDKYVTYKEKMKLSTSYGEEFFKFLAADGKVHTNFNQILDTGRVASRQPNMQQIPGNNTFRNCFVAPEGYVFVSSDYSSQELNVIAFGSKDPVWLKALEDGQDLHSVCADLVYGSKWVDQAEPDCAYMKNKSKCKCPEHKKLRTNVKTVNFGLAYGMGPQKLADTLSISLKEAKSLIEEYFVAFPAIGTFLDKLGSFGKKFGYIKTFPPYRRKRWFPDWYPKIWDSISARNELGSIERASKNTPIQGASADMTKLALIYIRDYINEHKIPVKIVMTVHDQIDTVCKEEYAEEWKTIITELMEQAALKIVTNGLLKADTNISKTWEK